MITRAQVLQDPTSSHWLKDCLRTSEKRDKTDLLNDLEILNQVVTDEALNHAQLLEHQINQIKSSNMIDFEMLECELR
jgi:hypothetical protein